MNADRHQRQTLFRQAHERWNVREQVVRVLTVVQTVGREQVRTTYGR